MTSERSRRRFLRITASLAAGVSLGIPPASASGSDTAGTLTALLFYATEGDGSDAPERQDDTAGETARHEGVLREATSSRRFFLIGKHSAPIQSRFSIWLKPSPQFPLQLENTGTTADGGLSLYWILWQKETPPTKDRELVKSTTVLTTRAPLVIVGPKWRQGRLVFVVRRDA